MTTDIHVAIGATTLPEASVRCLIATLRRVQEQLGHLSMAARDPDAIRQLGQEDVEEFIERADHDLLHLMELEQALSFSVAQAAAWAKSSEVIYRDESETILPDWFKRETSRNWDRPERG